MDVASPLPSAIDADRRSDQIARSVGRAIIVYLVVSTWPVWLHARATGSVAPLALHLAALSYASAVLAARGPIRRPALDWLVLTVGPFMYVELRWIIAGIGMPHHDALLVAWEGRLFPSNPSASLAPQWGSRVLSEGLHLAYASYYLLVYVPPILLYVRRRRDAFVATMLALAIVYGVCFVTYALFPVDGPRYLVGPAAAPDGPVRRFVLALLERGSSRGTAFPSSHVAASLVSALCAFQYSRRVGVVVSSLALALTVATVYGGFHYAVDALVGVMLGALSWAASVGVWTGLDSRGAHTATAA
jgi:membrane-associated phospholipid phosphatase